jgi:phosphocarrier protein
MTEKTIVIKNRAGMHARPSSLVVQTTKNFSSSIYLEKGRDRINAKSIMGLLTLAASYGTEVKIIAEGDDEEEAVAALADLFDSKFAEE